MHMVCSLLCVYVCVCVMPRKLAARAKSNAKRLMRRKRSRVVPMRAWYKFSKSQHLSNLLHKGFVETFENFCQVAVELAGLAKHICPCVHLFLDRLGRPGSQPLPFQLAVAIARA